MQTTGLVGKLNLPGVTFISATMYSAHRAFWREKESIVVVIVDDEREILNMPNGVNTDDVYYRK